MFMLKVQNIKPFTTVSTTSISLSKKCVCSQVKLQDYNGLLPQNFVGIFYSNIFLLNRYP